MLLFCSTIAIRLTRFVSARVQDSIVARIEPRKVYDFRQFRNDGEFMRAWKRSNVESIEPSVFVDRSDSRFPLGIDDPEAFVDCSECEDIALDSV